MEYVEFFFGNFWHWLGLVERMEKRGIIIKRMEL